RGECGVAVLRLAAQDRRRVDRRRDELRELGVEQLSAVLGDAELSAEEALSSRRAEEDENARLDRIELRLEPRTARGRLRPVRLLVDAAFPARLPLEVLDGVRDVGRRAVDTGGFERVVEHPPGRPDERPSCLVLLVTGLLADEHRRGVRGALAEDRLRPDLPQVAALAPGGCLAQGGQREPCWQEVGRGARCRLAGHRLAIPSTGGFETASVRGCCKRPVPRGGSPAARTGFTTMSDHALPLRLVGEAAEPFT